jgi:phage protein D
MGANYQLLFNGHAADPSMYTDVTSIEVEEGLDLPGAVQLSLPVVATPSGDMSYISDARLQPFSNIAVVVTPPSSSTSSGLSGVLGGSNGASSGQCIFDGYVLSHKLHLETGTANSTLSVWGHDASWMMNLTEKTREWVNLTDADVANSIFGEYGITPASDNTTNDSPSHTEAGHSLMQCASDIRFLRMLARRSGKFCRVVCNGQPGQRTGYFAAPNLSGSPAATITLNDPTAWTIDSLDLHFDTSRPTSVVARQAVLNESSPSVATGDTSSSGLSLLGNRGLADFTSNPMTVMLAAPVDDTGELSLRAAAVLRESSWFVKCEGEADLQRLGVVLRAGNTVTLNGVGSLHSGTYLVWSVRHVITPQSYKMKFSLVRNAIGNAATGGAGGLASMGGNATG